MSIRAISIVVAWALIVNGALRARASEADIGRYAGFIRVAGNAEDDTVRLAHLRKLADQCQRDGVTLAGLERLIAFIERWTSLSERLEFFSNEVIRTRDFDLGVEAASPLAPLAAFYRARMLVWVTLEYSDIYPYPEKRAEFLGKARRLLEQARDAFPKNRVIRMYLGEALQPAGALDVPAGAPAWAVAQREALERLTDVIDWWIDRRLRPGGEYGGGWGDDCEMWRHWAPVLIGFNYPKANWAQAYHSERLLAQPHLAGGYHTRMMDVEHTAEDVSDALTPMMHLAPGNPEWAQRALRLVELAETKWMGRNGRGFLQFKSTYFTANDVDLTPARACDTVYHPRALQPALLYWQRTGDERIGRLVADWMRTWVAAAARTERGKPPGMLPTAIHWPDGGIGGVGAKWWMPENYETPLYDFPSAMALMVNTLLQTYHQTGERTYLAPIESMAEARLGWMRADRSKPPQEGTRLWCAERLDQLVGALAKYRQLTGDSRFDTLLEAEAGMPYAQFLLSHDWSGLADGLDQLARVLRVNLPAYTSEVRYTDRVFRFPILYQPGWMLEQGASDPLLLVEGGVLAMGLNRVHLLYHTTTGDPGDPLYFPTNAVRWHTPPREIAVVVTDSSPQRFAARLFHFGTMPRAFEAELFLLAPGEYEYAVAEVRSGDSTSTGRFTIGEGRRRLALEIPAQREVILTIQAIK